MTPSSRPTDAMRAEQVAALYRDGSVGVVGALMAGMIVSALLVHQGAATSPRAIAWMVALATLAAIHLLLCLAYWRARPAPSQWRPWAGAFTAVSAGEGLIWGPVMLWAMPPPDFESLLLILMVGSAVASNTVAAFGAYLPAVYVLFFPTLLAYFGWAVTHEGPLSGAMALLVAIYTVMVGLLARRSNRNLAEALRLRFDNLALADDLKLQKEAADRASRAKSQFLASASHDLRQPVHALSLFIGALRARRLDAEADRLVAHMHGSITALDELFAALLDISRLDAGIVHAERRDIDLQPLLARVAADHAAEATKKGLRLDLRPTEACVHTDPLLLERIVRNLVSNAVRYTDRGRVLIACRGRGDALRVEVRDTGRGIAAAQQELVFQEFYQVGNAERDRSQGLGLGLSIVHRLAALLDCPLQLRSTLGRGSMFAIDLPRVDTQPTRALRDAAPMQPPDRLLVLVIDDELAIQQAMQSLLSSWGHEVIAAGSQAEMLSQVADLPRRPDLLICDYRLRGSENGLDVVRHLQSEYNDELPALLVTGDTSPHRLQEAEASGLPVLHKPVTESQLRGAMAAALAHRDEV